MAAPDPAVATAPGARRLVVRVWTPHEAILSEPARSLRVPTETGQVGLRPRGEALVLVVEPGLVVLATDTGPRYVASAGGLLESDGATCTLYTPFAAAGAADEVLAALERRLATPDSELAARRALGELEQRIVHELRQRQPVAPAPVPARRGHEP
ncbi:MAG: hypothetical protein U1F43_28750 [Myxococcota bacterium]